MDGVTSTSLNAGATIVTPVTQNKLRLPGGGVTSISFFSVEMMVDISAPGAEAELIKQQANVLLQGDDVCASFAAGSPAAGDTIILMGVVPYVKDGKLCLRVFDQKQIFLFKKPSGYRTFGLSNEEFVEAKNLLKRK